MRTMPKPNTSPKPNKAPKNLDLSGSVLMENTVGADIGVLTSRDDKGDTVIWSVDDDRFEVVSDLLGRSVLRLKAGVSVDFETQPSIVVQITATDSGGLSTTKSFTIAVANAADAPTGINLSPTAIDENSPSGTDIGTLATVDQDANDSFTYQLVSGDGVNDADNGLVVIDGNTIRVKAGALIDFETNPILNLLVQTTDISGLAYTKELAVTVNDLTGLNLIGERARKFGLIENVLFGSPEDDNLTGGDFVSEFGTDYAPSSDTVVNRLYGEAGDDTLIGGFNSAGTVLNQLYGGDGNDLLRGGVTSWFLGGRNTTNDLYGGAGDDRLFGGNDFGEDEYLQDQLFVW